MAGRYDAILLDLDGVLYRGDATIPGAPEAMERIRSLGGRIVFITNNSARTPEQVAQKLERHGIPASPEEVVTSALATADMLRREGSEGARAFVIGERGIREALGDAGVDVLDGEPETADLVVVGWDRSADYDKLKTASLLVQRGARLIATNPDASFPAANGMWPGAGALLAVITTTTGATPTIIGKPGRPLFEAARERTGASDPLVVGDRLDTDIGGARAMGWDSFLVLTGAARPGDLVRDVPLPTFVGRDLGAVLDQIPPARFRVATNRDEDALRALLTDSGLSAEGLSERLADTLVSGPALGSEEDGRLAASACLDRVEGWGILRSVCVARAERGKGLGVLVVGEAVARARREGIRSVSLFTQTAARFFERLGFRELERAELPQPVRESRHATEECAEAATPMVLDVEGHSVASAQPPSPVEPPSPARRR